MYNRILRNKDEDDGGPFEDGHRPAGCPISYVLKCGATAVWDRSSGCGYRCHDCFAVLGSVGCTCPGGEIDKEASAEREKRLFGQVITKELQ